VLSPRVPSTSRRNPLRHPRPEQRPPVQSSRRSPRLHRVERHRSHRLPHPPCPQLDSQIVDNRALLGEAQEALLFPRRILRFLPPHPSRRLPRVEFKLLGPWVCLFCPVMERCRRMILV
jgi:hypothetical protein